ncbi:hypothetical protein mRhiFer1_011411 [Rhinolophus ferrumequinum]|uniref:Uncharacterized protein n=1 Tax=Rhinolophus ferrumequinum TaxID=59479 RepID=A0A7J7Y629_RHIFE|nr:hypothetical protein mRhiFer1_011411 [Rhinolophus ferrumequinum]
MHTSATITPSPVSTEIPTTTPTTITATSVSTTGSLSTTTDLTSTLTPSSASAPPTNIITSSPTSYNTETTSIGTTTSATTATMTPTLTGTHSTPTPSHPTSSSMTSAGSTPTSSIGNTQTAVHFNSNEHQFTKHNHHIHPGIYYERHIHDSHNHRNEFLHGSHYTNRQDDEYTLSCHIYLENHRNPYHHPNNDHCHICEYHRFTEYHHRSHVNTHPFECIRYPHKYHHIIPHLLQYGNNIHWHHYLCHDSYYDTHAHRHPQHSNSLPPYKQLHDISRLHTYQQYWDHSDRHSHFNSNEHQFTKHNHHIHPGIYYERHIHDSHNHRNEFLHGSHYTNRQDDGYTLLCHIYLENHRNPYHHPNNDHCHICEYHRFTEYHHRSHVNTHPFECIRYPHKYHHIIPHLLQYGNNIHWHHYLCHDSYYDTHAHRHPQHSNSLPPYKQLHDISRLHTYQQYWDHSDRQSHFNSNEHQFTKHNHHIHPGIYYERHIHDSHNHRNEFLHGSHYTNRQDDGYTLSCHIYLENHRNPYHHPNNDHCHICEYHRLTEYHHRPHVNTHPFECIRYPHKYHHIIPHLLQYGNNIHWHHYLCHDSYYDTHAHRHPQHSNSLPPYKQLHDISRLHTYQQYWDHSDSQSHFNSNEHQFTKHNHHIHPGIYYERHIHDSHNHRNEFLHGSHYTNRQDDGYTLSCHIYLENHRYSQFSDIHHLHSSDHQYLHDHHQWASQSYFCFYPTTGYHFDHRDHPGVHLDYLTPYCHHYINPYISH